jgi:hypothetical protein
MMIRATIRCWGASRRLRADRPARQLSGRRVRGCGKKALQKQGIDCDHADRDTPWPRVVTEAAHTSL